MTLTKRGLGRGLEALLTEVPIMAETALHSQGLAVQQDHQVDQFVVAELQHPVELTENKQTLRGVLLNEAEALKSFLEDFETMVQHHSL